MNVKKDCFITFDKRFPGVPDEATLKELLIVVALL